MITPSLSLQTANERGRSTSITHRNDIRTRNIFTCRTDDGTCFTSKSKKTVRFIHGESDANSSKDKLQFLESNFYVHSKSSISRNKSDISDSSLPQIIELSKRINEGSSTSSLILTRKENNATVSSKIIFDTVVKYFRMGSKACHNPGKIIRFYRDHFDYTFHSKSGVVRELSIKYKDMIGPIASNLTYSFEFQLSTEILSAMMSGVDNGMMLNEFYTISMEFMTKNHFNKFQKQSWPMIFYMASS
jgi:hypothetical protein